MGNALFSSTLLKKPVTEKTSMDDENEFLRYGASNMQGWRRTQEDAHTCLPNFDPKTSLFAVFDGHGGGEVALYCAQNLPQYIKETKAYIQGNYKMALTEGLMKFDASINTEQVKVVLNEISCKIIAEHNKRKFELKRDRNLAEENLGLVEFEKNENEFQDCNNSLKEIEFKKNLNIAEEDSNKPVEYERSENKCGDSNNILMVGEGVKIKVGINNLADQNEQKVKVDEAEVEVVKEDKGINDVKDREEQDDESKESNNSNASSNKSFVINADTGLEESCESEDCCCCEDEEEDDEDDSDYEEDLPTENPGFNSGCTALIVLLHLPNLFVANLGDSRCVLSQNGQALDMSFDHKPNNPSEAARIIKAGGIVQSNRINGGLNLSRAIGDYIYKQNQDLSAVEQMVIASPDIVTYTINPLQDEFIILVSDGVSDAMSNQELVDFVRSRIDTAELSKICEQLFEHCLAPRNSKSDIGLDNMTTIIVQFKQLEA